MRKNYLLDTSVILQNPNAVFEFEDNNIWITGTTLQEIDAKKSMSGEEGYAAREAARILDQLINAQKLTDRSGYIELPNGGELHIEPDGVKKEYLPDGFTLSNPSNRIISTCIHLNRNECAVSPVILLTNDISLRVNASICGIEAESVKNDQVDLDQHYTGHTNIKASSQSMSDLYRNGSIEVKEIIDESDENPCNHEFYENEFATITTWEHGSALSIHKNGKLYLINNRFSLFGGITPLNKMQTYALYALMAPAEEIPLVILQGPAGTAKTFLSLVAALSQTDLGRSFGYNKCGDREPYQKILISRPNAGSSDPGFGYLPGDLDEKMAPLLASYYDNLEVILRGKHKKEDASQIKLQMEDLFESGAIEICPLNFIRGRSLSNSFIICDEAQNATKNLIRDVITRAGQNSKVVITGDETQCDAPTLDRYNNGLVYAAEKMRGNPLCACIKFGEEQCVRSPLAEAAIKAMR